MKHLALWGYALELFQKPEKHQCDSGHYRIGYGAYDNWINAVKDGQGDSHGNWWNGMVWSECRQMGAEFFSQLSETLEGEEAKNLANELSTYYREMGENLGQIKEKNLESEKKIHLLKSTLELEHQVEGKIQELLQQGIQLHPILT